MFAQAEVARDARCSGQGGGPYVSRLEEDMRDVKAAGSRLEATTMRIGAMLAATLPHLATTKAELRADLPSKTCMWAILAVLLTAYACGLAGLAVLK
jgi:Na+/citrate or Na+/malate symporter